MPSQKLTSKAILPRHRQDDILLVFAKAVGPQILEDQRLSSFKVEIDNVSRPLADWAEMRGYRHDPRAYLGAIARHAEAIYGNSIAASDLRSLARDIKRIASDAYHGGDVSEFAASRTAQLVSSLLQKLGHSQTASEVLELAAPPQIQYVLPLRRVLQVASKRRDPLLTYQQAATSVGLPWNDFGERQLHRQLNVLAAKQLLLAEPQLCALVVLPDKRIPGDGFYWVVDLPRNAPEETKRNVHAEAVKAVRAHKW